MSVRHKSGKTLQGGRDGARLVVSMALRQDKTGGCYGLEVGQDRARQEKTGQDSRLLWP